jgi:hypothetical protein
MTWGGPADIAAAPAWNTIQVGTLASTVSTLRTSANLGCSASRPGSAMEHISSRGQRSTASTQQAVCCALSNHRQR